MFKTITRSIVLLLICIFFNQLLATIFGSNITSFIFAPMNEETIRLVSVLQGPPLNVVFTFMLSFFEFSGYLKMARINYGYIPNIFLILRIWCVILHFIFLSCQLYGWRLYIKKNKKRYLIAGYITAIFLHFLWNNFGSIIIEKII
ncbi:MAG: hypothetical protein ACFFG0_01665 [Candidatus Thorarchaeota archaeon]